MISVVLVLINCTDSEPSGSTTVASLTALSKRKRNGVPACTESSSAREVAGFSQSIALATKIGKDTRSGQVLCSASKPTHTMRWLFNSPASTSGVCGDSTSGKAHGGVLTARLSLTKTF